MKKNFILAVFCLIISAMTFAQVPQKMSYQAVVRGSDNNLVTNSEVSVRVSILQGSVDGEAVYTETHSATTNANGLLTIEIGTGAHYAETFSSINWANGPYFVKTETDVNGGNNYDIIGVSQLLSVPYAMYAQMAGNVPDVSGFLTEETDPTVSEWAKAENKPVYSYSEIEGTPEIPTVPTNVSAFTNDANYLTSYTESQTLADVVALGNSVNAQLKNVADPTDAQDAATKSYVDNLIAQLQAVINNSAVTTGTLNGYDWIDLGLPSGIRWATCNVGASSPTSYGNYYAWGEIMMKTSYEWNNYRYCNGDYNKLIKYCNNAEYGYNGFTDNLTTLEASDDAATANWGFGWRMPTREEFNELYSSCTNEWIIWNGVNGIKFTGPNGNSIFLPAAGYRDNVSLNNAGSYGYYWSSSLYLDHTEYARYLYFIYSSGYYVYSHIRCYGLSVRPVCAPTQN